MSAPRRTSIAGARASHFAASTGPLAVVASIAVSLGTATLSSGEQPSPELTGPASSARGKPALETVTIDAKRKRKEVERAVSHFVFFVPVRYLDDSLSRWNKPICPLVAGLPREQGEFMLARLSQIATSAKAPLAGEHCKANYYVVVTSEPDALLKKWRARDRDMFVTRNGLGSRQQFPQHSPPGTRVVQRRLRFSRGQKHLC